MGKFLVLIIFIAVIFNPKTIGAQTATSSPQTTRDRLINLKEDRREFVQDTREQMKEKMEAFKSQIRAIKDTRKQLLTERIADKVASANARLTNKMDKALDHLTDILNRVTEKAAAFKAQGKDTTALDAAITTAANAITTAKNAVDAQKSKEYTANITDESTLRNTIGQMVSQFRLDIQAVHKLIVDAKQAVMKAIMEAAKLRGEDNTATGSANI
ncbi:MAG: hypothetical protein A3C30_04355 [Candidatus Levybacteria bacterium RIFCSPHIGHO2_02_FULL_40_18]|nr:MAG: hypothetical protein A2869_01685 [Candidatus Levybacteria bacterium RIFCSPHIGHO2_01_FULL_40_58]OGH26313.1 MAG: hypothetical protein A3C30_04355 [Candidatus Levybacteria bacterium RIFCSPHIGHO2_02_FULL_40_18]OGH31272.1 MAG: hypothetical protein A3E43_02610 [Candidatus Levybacteria bacterium RIFCSPHIGHO2_12_FULL_40_31]OGH40342.1 MAG: hypothetical protein A2894_05320 [Candidatus Levybacteria bacterium RIFCSPLOWO2_01_FULL_40_64]OGH49231.1 MAG: hypothetical protein A3I54_01120 [Candidatus Lev